LIDWKVEIYTNSRPTLTVGNISNCDCLTFENGYWLFDNYIEQVFQTLDPVIVTSLSPILGINFIEI
jgi:hypothetical protein